MPHISCTIIINFASFCNIPNFQFGMLYIRPSLHIIIYLLLVLILEIPRNSRTHGESWGFRYFHIWVPSNFENRIIWFYLFYHQLFLLQKYERGNKMTFPKKRNIEDLIIKSNKILSRSFLVFYFEFRKNVHFSKLHIGPK